MDEILNKSVFNKQMALITTACACTFKSKGSVKVRLIQKALLYPAERPDLLPTPSVRCSAAWESGLRWGTAQASSWSLPGASGTSRSTCAPQGFARPSYEASTSGTGKCRGRSQPQGEGGRAGRRRPAGGSGLRLGPRPGRSFCGAGVLRQLCPQQQRGRSRPRPQQGTEGDVVRGAAYTSQGAAVPSCAVPRGREPSRAERSRGGTAGAGTWRRGRSAARPRCAAGGDGAGDGAARGAR